MYKVKNMSLTRKVAYNTGALIFGRGVNVLLSLVAVGVLTRYLGVAGFGQYTTVFAFVSLFNTFADFGFMMILLRELGAGRYDPQKITRNILTIRTIFAILVYALAFGVGWILDYPLIVQLGIGVIALSFLFTTIQGSVIAVLQANLRADKAVVGDVLDRLIVLGLILWLIHSGAGLLALFAAYPLGAIISLIINCIFANKYIRLGFAFDYKLWWKLIGEIWPLGIAGIFAMVYFKIDSVMLSLMKTPTDIGIYGAPYKIFEVLLSLSALFMGVAFPILSRYVQQKRKIEFDRALQKSIDFLGLLALPIMAFCIILAPAIIRIIAGESFVTAYTINLFGIPMTTVITLQILSLTILLSYMTNIFNNLVIAAGKQGKLMIPNFFLIIINIGLNAFLIPKFSYIGAAVATILTEVVALVWYWVLSHKFIDFRLSAAAFGKGIIATLVMMIVVYLTRNTFIAVPLILGSAIYVGIVLATKAVSKDMVVEIVRGNIDKS